MRGEKWEEKEWKSHVYYREHWNRERPSNYLLCLHSLKVKSYLMTSLLPQPSTTVKAPTQTSSYTNGCTEALLGVLLVLFPNVFTTPSQSCASQYSIVRYNGTTCIETSRSVASRGENSSSPKVSTAVLKWFVKQRLKENESDAYDIKPQV